MAVKLAPSEDSVSGIASDNPTQCRFSLDSAAVGPLAEDSINGAPLKESVEPIMLVAASESSSRPCTRARHWEFVVDHSGLQDSARRRKNA